MKAAILYSGGMDSSVLLHDYHAKGFIKLAVSFNYGSKHNDKEFEYAQRNTKKLGIEHIRIDMRSVMENFKSDLLKSGGDIPEGHYAEESMKRTVVPFRNGIMLSILAGIAESKELDTILIANHFGDASQYPDCKIEFIEPMTSAIEEGTGTRVRILAPYTQITKTDIANIGAKLNVDFSDTWSCYKGGDIQCGKCGTCVERIISLRGLNDKTVYLDSEYSKQYAE